MPVMSARFTWAPFRRGTRKRCALTSSDESYQGFSPRYGRQLPLIESAQVVLRAHGKLEQAAWTRTCALVVPEFPARIIRAPPQHAHEDGRNLHAATEAAVALSGGADLEKVFDPASLGRIEGEARRIGHFRLQMLDERRIVEPAVAQDEFAVLHQRRGDRAKRLAVPEAMYPCGERRIVGNAPFARKENSTERRGTLGKLAGLDEGLSDPHRVTCLTNLR